MIRFNASARHFGHRSRRLDVDDHDPAATLSTTSDSHLIIHIIATTESGTRVALETGRALARDLDPRIILLVPHVVPYPQELDDSDGASATVAERFALLTESMAANIVVVVCKCRPHAAALVPFTSR